MTLVQVDILFVYQNMQNVKRIMGAIQKIQNNFEKSLDWSQIDVKNQRNSMNSFQEKLRTNERAWVNLRTNLQSRWVQKVIVDSKIILNIQTPTCLPPR